MSQIIAILSCVPKINALLVRPVKAKAWNLNNFAKNATLPIATTLARLIGILVKLKTSPQPVKPSTQISSLGVNYLVLEVVLNKAFGLRSPHDFFETEVAQLDAQLGGKLTVRGLADYIDMKVAVRDGGN